MSNDGNLRDKLMGEKEQDLAKRYQEYFRRAVRDKQSQNIPENLIKFERYWEGDVNKPEGSGDPGSNVNIIHPNIEGQVAMLIEQNISINPLPVTPSDSPFAEMVRVVLEFIKDKNSLIRKLDMHERRREKYGTGILRVTFDPDALGGLGLPIIDCVPNHRIYVDPCVTDAFCINEAEFIIETMVKSVYWARETYGNEIAEAIIPNYFPEEAEDAFDEQGEGKADNDKYLHMLVWTLEGGKLRLVEMTGCGLILSDSGKGRSFYPTAASYPYFFTPLYRREGSIWGKGDVELLIPLQDLINDLDDQIRLSARLTGNPQRLISVGSGIDLDALTNEAGLNIPVNDINAVRNLTPPLPDYIEKRRNMALQYETQRVSRFSDQMTGNKQKGVDTATEALALQQAGTLGIQHKKLLLQETLSEVFSYCLEMVREFWNRETAIRVTDSKDEFIFFSGKKLKGIPVLRPADEDYIRKFERGNPGKPLPKHMIDHENTKSAEFDIKVTVGAGMPTNRAFMYNVMIELTRMGLVTQSEMRKWLVSSLGLPIELKVQESPAPGQDGGEERQILQSPDVQGLNLSGNVAPSQSGGGLVG